MGLFLHFGIRTFYEGHRDWDGKPMPLEGFQPTELDCDNWIEAAAQAGMKYSVLVTKHHDGFANWPSKFSKYSVAHTAWKDGKGDVVGEYVAACRKHGVKAGFYYSPAEWGSPIYEDAKAYNDHFVSQMNELLGNYGTIDVLWFDGAGSGGHTYDWPRVVGEIRRLQPDIVNFGMGDPDCRWVGNEDGIANLPNWNTFDVTPWGDCIVDVDGTGPIRWLPAECDCKLRWGNWFYSDEDEWTIKPVEALMSLYYLSVGRGANLLMNVCPDRRGLLPDADRERLLQFGEEIRLRFGRPLATMADGQTTETGWEYVSDSYLYIDHVIVQEDLTRGEAVRRFAIHVWLGTGGPQITVHEGRNIGHKAICRFPLVPVKKVIVEIVEADGPVTFRSVELHNAYARVSNWQPPSHEY